jgi:YegS/Rv2252/BmrU family lipid kinase
MFNLLHKMSERRIIMNNDDSIHLILAAFPEFHGAEEAFAKMNVTRRIQGVKAAVILQKDLTGQLHTQDIGLTPGKGAAGGVVLGAVVGVLTGGAGLALGALGGILGGQKVKRTRESHLTPDLMKYLVDALAPGYSAILAVAQQLPPDDVQRELEALGANLFLTEISAESMKQMESHGDVAYSALLNELEVSSEPVSIPYPRIHIVVNPAAGQDEPILNTLNTVFRPYNIDWDVSITRKYGDATRFARRAAEAGYDLVVGYGGDGTQHEIANGIIGTRVTMGILPGGSGNGFANEMNIPKQLAPAVKLLCTSRNKRRIDVVQMGDSYFVQRLFTGIEPEEQASREMKDKYGTLAYLMRDAHLLKEVQDIPYRLRIDGEEIEIQGYKCYVVNSAKAGTGLSMSHNFSVEDGYLDVFMLSKDIQSVRAAIDRFLNLPTEKSSLYYWRGQEVSIEAEPSQPVWTDGEYSGRTPVTVKLLPGALTIAVP